MKRAPLITVSVAAVLPTLFPGAGTAAAAFAGGNGDRGRESGEVFTPNPARGQRSSGPA